MGRVWVVLVGLLWTTCGAASAKEWSLEEETKIGQQALAAVLQEYGEWQNEERLARVQQIVDYIAPRSTRPDVRYQAHLLDDDHANALSIPGGYVCVSRGLLGLQADGTPLSDLSRAVQSDDELAGVLAHEIAHNLRYDALNEAHKQKKLLQGSLLAIVASVMLGAGGSEVFAVAQGGELYAQGIISAYSVEIEARADRTAVDLLLGSEYNPVGLLTFLERGAARYRSASPGGGEVVSPYIELGVYQTHPYPLERTAMLRNYLHQRGVSINRRATTQWERAEAVEGLSDGQPVAHLFLWEDEIFRFHATTTDGQTPSQRATHAVEVLNDALAAGLKAYDITVEQTAGEAAVSVMGKPMLHVLPGDAAPAGMLPAELAQQVVQRLEEALFRESIRRTFTPQ